MLILLVLVILLQPAQIVSEKGIVAQNSTTFTASWVSEESLKNEGTWDYSKGVMANGQRFRTSAYTCASNDWPLGTLLLVSNSIDPNKHVRVQVTDRLNKRYTGKRIDLTKVAFACLEKPEKGLVSVKVRALGPCLKPRQGGEVRTPL